MSTIHHMLLFLKKVTSALNDIKKHSLVILATLRKLVTPAITVFYLNWVTKNMSTQ
jgi:hypothetical protein